MGVLSDILQYKEYQDNVARQNVASIGSAVDTLNQLRQQGIKNRLSGLQVGADLATNGLGLDQSGQLVRNTGLMNPASLVSQMAQLQANAKQAGNSQLYSLAGNSLSSLLGNPQTTQQPTGTLLSQFIQTSGQTAHTAATVAQTHNDIQAANAQAQEQQQQTQEGQPAASAGTQSAQGLADTAPPNAASESNAMASGPDFTTQKDPFTGEPTLQARLQQNALDIQKNAASKTKEYGDQQATGFANASAKLQLTLENWHKMVQATQQATGVGPGRINGVLSKIGGMTGSNPYYEPFKTSLLETEVQLAKLSAPSARIGPDLIKTFGVVAPTEFSNSKEARNNFVTSLTNAYSTYATSNPEKFPDGANIDKFQDMASKMYDDIIGQTALSSKFKDGAQYKAGNKTVTFKGGRFFDANGKLVNVNIGKS